MISSILSRLVILLFGTLYPAYASYKAVRTKNVKEYVKWMMYWIVFALFTCIETFTDVFLSWFPFYYEIKIILVIWLLSPATKGSSILYRKFVHPTLSSKEQEIDEYITKAKEQSYKQVLDLGTKGVSALMQTAIKGGGGLVNQLKKSYSLSDLSDPSQEDVHDETDSDIRLSRRRRSPLRSSTTSAIYFSEVDVRSDRIASIQSAEDISSGYSSGEGLYTGQPLKLLAREGLQRTGSLTRSRTTRVTRSSVPKKGGGSDDSDDNEIFDTNIVFYNDNKNDKDISLVEEDIKNISSSETEFFDSIDSLHDTLGGNTINKKDHDSKVLIACLENRVSSDAELISLSKHISVFPHVANPPLDANKENRLQQNVEIKHVDDNDTHKSLEAIDIDEKNDEIKPESIAKLTTNIDGLNSVNSIEQNKEFNNQVEKILEPPEKPKRFDKFEDAVEQLDLSSAGSKQKIRNENTSNSESKLEKSPLLDRGGKYNKRAAPPPPSKTDQSTPIKATLVLQPGVVKNCLPEGNTDCKNLFFHSPKARCRNLVKRSHSSLSSTSTSSSKTKQSLSKLMKFPKMIGFWNRDEPCERKPSSTFFVEHNSLKPLLSDSKLQSKSDNNLSKTDESMNLSMHGTNLPKSGSLVSIRSLTESPLTHRRLKIIRRYVDDDID